VLLLSGVSNTIGGSAPGARNVISGNGGSGVQVAASGHRVQGNYVGTDKDGTGPLGNGQNGVAIASGVNSTTVGGANDGEGNVIAFNSGDGVFAASGSGTRHEISRNAMFSNGGLGIDHFPDGPTPNDVNDADAGPNNLQNFPVMTVVQVSTDGDLVIQYLVDSTPANAMYNLRIEFFDADSAAGGEGRTFLGSDTYPLAQAQMSRVVNLGNAAGLGVALGDPIVATARTADDNTSEFSAAVTVGTGAPPTAVDVSSFTAQATDRGTVRLRWETVSEIDLAGFNLLRSESADGPFEPINADLIVAQSPGGPTGATYQFVDGSVGAGRMYFYQLELVRLDGRRTRVGLIGGGG
jgi:hypothetical protein